MSKKTVMHLLEELFKRCKEVGGIQFDTEKLINDFSLARLAVK